MLRAMLFAGLTGVVVAGCATEMSRSERAVEEQALRSRLTEWRRLLNNRNADSLAQFYFHDASLVVAWPDGQRAEGWETEAVLRRDFFRRVATMNIVVQDPTTVVLSRQAAVTTFRYSADLIFATTDRDVSAGHGTLVWAKDPEDGVWRIRAEQLSRNPTS